MGLKVPKFLYCFIRLPLGHPYCFLLRYGTIAFPLPFLVKGLDSGLAYQYLIDQILRNERGEGNIHFSFSADHVQDWQPYPVDPYSCYMCDHTSKEYRASDIPNLHGKTDYGNSRATVPYT